MPLVKLKFRPGVDKEVTDYENTLGWFDTDKVRFRAGYPENIGGWTPYSSASFVGICRTLLPWVALDSSEYVAVPTSSKTLCRERRALQGFNANTRVFNYKY